ncbi:MAG TPA: 1,2-phenylacetyl-CoA epoxidase subunit PaaC [Chitinophagaceae bacterium]|nr:1,2-phenylacetyl-CoA epoxidase subunit PaaC [Chitinophagaceae bacterium]
MHNYLKMHGQTSVETTEFLYTLHLADNVLILGQRNSEWCGHGPVLEQDIAITNISLDLLGQARNLYQHAASLYNSFTVAYREAVDQYLPRAWKSYRRELNEDDLAFLRDERQYLNLLICELPKGDWAQTLLRQYLFSSFQLLLFTTLRSGGSDQLAAIAEKAVKEITYHVRWSGEWVVRLGDGTEESRRRMLAAIDNLKMYIAEFFIAAHYENQVPELQFGSGIVQLKQTWKQQFQHLFEEATLPLDMLNDLNSGHGHTGGKEGRHTEHLGYILTEMQYMQRSYPDLKW